MTMQLKKLALAVGASAVLAAASLPAQAFIEGDAGEANLVPFVVWDDSILDPNNPNPDLSSINTVVKITVPGAVGNKTIPNVFTAQHTTPTNSPAPGVPGFSFIPDPDLLNAATARIHWYFLDQRSQHVHNGSFPVTPNDVVVFDWGAQARASGIQSTLNGKVGYLVFTTEAASTGVAPASFSFFAEAWLIAGVDGDIPVLCGGDPVNGPTSGCGTIGILDAKIPVLPLSDDADPVVNGTPTVNNQVVQRGTNFNIKVSPLISGIPTNWSDGVANQVKEVDVTLGNRSTVIGPLINPVQIPTLVVVWNDRNNGNWTNLGVLVYNDQEESCSSSVSLPWQLNLLWVQTDVTVPYPTPAFINKAFAGSTQGQKSLLCVPPANNPFPLADFAKLLQGGFIRFILPEPVDTGINAPESAAAIFSIPLQYNVNFEAGLPIGASLVPFSTALGHDRGIFTQ